MEIKAVVLLLLKLNDMKVKGLENLFIKISNLTKIKKLELPSRTKKKFGNNFAYQKNSKVPSRTPKNASRTLRGTRTPIWESLF